MDRRRQLLGWQGGDRRWIAQQLGISVRTIERYENGGAPAWYNFALKGLAAHLGPSRE